MNNSEVRPGATLEALVAELPEKYQPIYGFPELSEGSSRACQDRLEHILAAARALSSELQRPLRVLDLGCAQGFFSLHLASEGHNVQGFDFLQKNIDVCQELARLNGFPNARFECGLIEDVIGGLPSGTYDLVLGLSVFHHLVHQHGLDAVVPLVTALAQKVRAGIYELALRAEPLYWAPSLPEDPAALLQGYSFQRVLASQDTHLSHIARPLYFASSFYWYLGGKMDAFSSWRDESHAFSLQTHRGTRRYYFGDGVMVKQFSLKDPSRATINAAEYHNEVALLKSGAPEGFRAAVLLEQEGNDQTLCLKRKILPGEMLSELITKRVPYSYEAIFDGLLEQLVALEAAGLYHNDVRCWNVLVGPDGVCLVDYGAISPIARDCAWPEDLLLALLLTLREIVHAHVVEPFPVRRPQLSVAVLPVRYRNAFVRLFALDRSEWSYKRLRDYIAEDAEVLPVPAWNELVAAQERAAVRFQETLATLREEANRLSRSLGEREALVAELASRVEGTENDASDLKRRLDEAEQGVAHWRSESERFESTAASLLENQSAAGSDLIAVRAQVQELLAGNEGLRDEREQLAARLEACEARAERFEQQAMRLKRVHDLSEVEFELFEEKSSAARRIMRESEAKLRELEAQLSASLGNAHHWFLRSNDFERKLEQLHSSNSWRLTRPLRLFAKLLRYPRQTVKDGVAMMARRLQRRPGLMQRVGRLTKRIPALHRRLVVVASDHGLVVPAAAPPINELRNIAGVAAFGQVGNGAAGAKLSARGQRIYEEMKEKFGKMNTGARG